MEEIDLDLFKTSRSGQKLMTLDEVRTLTALPEDLLEKIWIEILQKEETDLFIFEIREEIVNAALGICYEKYMERQSVVFTVHCAVQAWLKLIDWHFYRHDPGDEVGAHPPCFIPNSETSWIPDELPNPSPKDSWAPMDVAIELEEPEEVVTKSSSATSLDYPKVPEIPSKYWFPGKVDMEIDDARDEVLERTITYTSSSLLDSSTVGSSNEVVEQVTEYPEETPASKSQLLPHEDAAEENTPAAVKPKKKLKPKAKTMKKKSKAELPPLTGTLPPKPSVMTMMSDFRSRGLRAQACSNHIAWNRRKCPLVQCKLETINDLHHLVGDKILGRWLNVLSEVRCRLETQYEISSEHAVDDKKKKK